PVGAPSGPILLKFLLSPNEKSWQLLMALMPAPLRARVLRGRRPGLYNLQGFTAQPINSQPWRGNVMPASRYIGSFLLAAGCALVLGGHSAHAQGAFTITSSSFKDGERFATKMAGNNKQNPNCVGENVSPALSWANPPGGTKSYALLMFDPEGRPPGGV